MEHIIENVNGVLTLKVSCSGSFREKESIYLKNIVLEQFKNIKSIEIYLHGIDDIDITSIQCCHSVREFCKTKNIDFLIKSQLTKTTTLLLMNCGLLSSLN